MRDNNKKLKDLPTTSNPLPSPGQVFQQSFQTPPPGQGTFFAPLPTKGKFYPQNHPLYGQEQVELIYMTAAHENIITNQNYLKQDIMFDKLIGALLVDTRIDPKTIHEFDKNAIILASRVDTYGPEYPVKIICDVCGAENDHTFNLEQMLKTEMEEFSGNHPGVQLQDDGTFTVDLPKSKISVLCKLLSRQELDALNEEQKKRKKLNLPENLATALLAKIIVEAPIPEGVSNSKWIEDLSLADSNAIKTAHAKISPKYNLREEVTCSSCENVEEYELPFTSGFFYPGRE